MKHKKTGGIIHLEDYNGMHYEYFQWKVSKYGVISGPFFPVFSPNTGKYGPEIAPDLDTFQVVKIFMRCF